MVGTVTFSAKRSNPHSRYTVCSRYPVHIGVSAKRSTHTVDLANMQWGMQYIVGVSAKRSTHTVDLANMGGGDCYL